ncbi:Thioredoxin domain-containing protein [[Candida] zeylanoides]
MSVIEIESEDQFSSITNEPHQLVVIYFHTPWAAPCQQMAAVFATLAAAHAGAKFVSVNADEHAEISELFEVSAVPYFVLVRDAVILRELSGADPKELAAAVAEAAAPAAATDAPAAAPGAAAASAVPAPSVAAPADAAESPEALNARLAKLVAAAPVMLFMKGSPSAPQCGFSRQLVAILREHQVRFGFFDILKDDAVRQGLKTFSDWPTFPQLYVKGELQGGLDIVKESLEEDPDFFAKATEA